MDLIRLCKTTPVFLVLLAACSNSGGTPPLTPTEARLASFSRASATQLVADERVQFQFATSGATPLQVSFVLTGPDLQPRTAQASATEASGSAEIAVGTDWPAGSYALDTITLTDSSGRKITYHSDGSVTADPTGTGVPSTHALDFSAAAFSVATSDVPRLVSITRTSAAQLAPGGTVQFDYAVQDAGHGIGGVIIGVTDPLGRTQQVRADGAAAAAGPAVATVGDTWADGLYQVTYVDIFDQSGHRVTYEAGGQVNVEPSGAIGPHTHAFDWSDQSFSVSNPGYDGVAPTLESFSLLSPTSVAVGDTVTFSFQVQETGSGMAYVIFGVADRSGRDHQVRVDRDAVASGQASAVVTSDWADGASTLHYIDVVDTAGNSANYEASGVNLYPSGVVGPTSNPFDFSAYGFTVSNPDYDGAAPELLSISLASAGTVHPDDTVSYDYSTHDDGGVRSVIIGLSDPQGLTRQIRRDDPDAGTGPASIVVGQDWLAGTYTVTYVDIFDTSGNRTTYEPSGVSLYPSGVSGPTSQSIDYPSLSINVAVP